MPSLPLRALAALSALWIALSPGAAAAQRAMSPEDKARVEEVVREYLLKNPEVIVEAMRALEQREQQARGEAQRRALSERRRELTQDPDAPVVGNPQGDVTLVEFFDYQCGYCKAVHPELIRLMEAEPKLRVVMKEFPILGPASVTAAKAALAARRQGKYLELHNALMEQRGQLDEAKVMRAAASVGLDVERLKADMEAPEVAAHLARNLRLAEDLQISGTPAFVVGNTVVPGAVSLETLLELVRAQRAG